MRQRITRIGLRPRHARLAGTLEVSGYYSIVGDFDKESLSIAHTISEFIGPPRRLRSRSGLPAIGIGQRQVGPGEREIRIQLNRALLQRNSRHHAFVQRRVMPRAECLQSFERSSRTFFQGLVVHLSRSQ